MCGLDERILYHCLEGLQKLLAQAEQNTPADRDLVFELQAGIQVVHEDFADTFTSLETLLPNNNINFENLWTLYPPNTVVWRGESLGHPQAYKVKKNTLVTDKNGMPWLVLIVDYIDSDGKNVGWVTNHDLRIPWFDDVKSIWNLPYIPIDMGPDPELIRQKLLDQGRLAMKRHGQQLVEYKGPGLRQIRGDWVKFNVHGRVMLDPQTWEDTQPASSAVPKLSLMSLKSLKEDEEKIMLLNGFVYGYSLGDKTWGKFSVCQTMEPEWTDKAFEALALDDGLKSFMCDLVSEHKARTSRLFDDIIRDKGKGLVGMLAGPPGVGKTLTAESIAEVSRRPLYTISSGELGHEPTEIHKKLTPVLELAEHWDAVVLLDEADVFLAARDARDLARNSIVSVFLRELEYYQGIIILTTDMTPSIDAAFKSRIHFSVVCPDRDVEGRRCIWRDFIDMATARNESLQVEISEDGMEVLSQMQLNGRQIKNLMSAAQTVALKRGDPLTVPMVKTAMSISQHQFLLEGI